MDELSFEDWLMHNTSYSTKVARDVRCRAKRASKYINLSKNTSDDELIFTLTQHPEFLDLSPTVKSQLKKSVKLYREFLLTTKKTK
ncbi:hypothetical protein BBG47_15875 [Paenibacillus sp. KS1]|uniref:hypothetical protein n=1 Tax=Paenibacillus sp. KS1 TaxID=1849249 RepID=UPI0008064EC4|nr:hypothetical protein [Paenibacillus sp. KS1]OBY78612.1 hypothetical protein BBG47_15875 [Paenibacillus sp. KS1]